jgi:hypothetical protein
MPILPDEPAPAPAPAGDTLAPMQPAPAESEIRPPGKIAQTYWFVLAGFVLALGLVGCYCAVLYGHWHPISFSPHYPST